MDWREWRIRHGLMLTVVALVAFAIGAGLGVLGLVLGIQWAIGQYVTPRAAEALLWRGTFTAGVGGAIVAVGAWCSPKAQAQEPTKGEW
jgi:hypothetical protein